MLVEASCTCTWLLLLLLLQIAHDPELLKDELRPLVFEEIRQQVEMPRIATGRNAAVAAAAANGVSTYDAMPGLLPVGGCEQGEDNAC